MGDKKKDWKFVCLWVSIAVVFFVFILPVETKVIGEEGKVEIRIYFTIWDKITGKRLSDKDYDLYIHGEEFRHR